MVIQPTRHGVGGTVSAIQQAFDEFLALPTLVVAAFLLLAAAMYAADQAPIPWLQPVSGFLHRYLFASPSSTASLLGTIAGSIITVTSITFSLLLLAIQQTASNLTSQVYDQFLRRSLNQFYLSYFVGLALYTLIILASANKPHNPVLGGAVALLLTLVALYILILLLYGAINQIRPSQVIESIHDLTLSARQRQASLLEATRRTSHSTCPVRLTACAGGYGYLTSIHLDQLHKPLQRVHGECEVILLVPLGSFVPFQGAIAQVKAATAEDAAILGQALPRVLQLGASRNIKGDPAYGIDQLVTIAWTSVSTAKQNLAPGTLTVHLLHDLLVHWVSGNIKNYDHLPVVYPDNVLVALLSAFEALGVISSLSIQYQIFAEIVQTFADTFDRIPPDLQHQAEKVILRLLSVLGDHVLTRELNEALCRLAAVLQAAGRHAVAEKVELATAELARSIGHLNSRSTRVPRSGS